MARFEAYSKFDGEPLPARSRAELEALYAEGHFKSQPTISEDGKTALAGEHGPEVELPTGTPAQSQEASDESSAGADGGDPDASEDGERIRDSGGRLDQPDGSDASMPPAARKRR